MRIRMSTLVVPLLGLPWVAKRIVALIADLGLCVLTVWFSYSNSTELEGKLKSL